MAAQPTPGHPSTMLAALEAATPTNTSFPLPAPLFRTKRLLARPMHPQDAPSMQAAASPPSITKYMTLAFAYPYTLAHAEAWIATNQAVPNNHLVLTPLSSPAQVVGGIGMKPGSDVQSHTGEVGYWLAEEAQGQGLMREALEGFVEWCFTAREGDGSVEAASGALAEQKKVLRPSRLFAGVFSGNAASMRCLESCGFLSEGVQRGHVEKHGEVMDLHLYGLTRGDWEIWRRERRAK